MTAGVLVGQTLPLFRNGEWYTSLDATAVGGRRSAAGGAQSAIGDERADPPAHGVALSLAPEAMVRHDLRQVRRRLAVPLDPFPSGDRRRAMADALDRFAGGTVNVPALGAQPPEAFARQLLDAAGLPPALVARWSSLLRARGREMLAAGAGIDDRSLHLVSLPSNTFTCLESCVASALACGVLWVRPSAREPFSALRFVASLVEAGWPAARLGFYGVAHASLSMLARQADAAIVYGGEDLERLFAGAAHVTVNGPGRAVAIVDSRMAPEAAAAWLQPLVASDAGRFCTNVGTILCLGDAEPIAAALAEALDAIGLGDPDWPLAFAPDEAVAARTAAALHDALRPGDRVETRRPILTRHEGRPLLAPTLVRLGDAAGHPLVGLEYPFPVAVVAEVSSADLPGLCRTARFVYRSGAA